MKDNFSITEAVFVSARREDNGWGQSFSDPAESRCARSLNEVMPLIEWLDARRREGYWGVLALAYEAAPAFEPRMAVRHNAGRPLALASVFREAGAPMTRNVKSGAADFQWKPSLERKAYVEKVERIREYIAAGDTYQVNFTFPLFADFRGEPHEVFDALCRAQGAGYNALLRCGDEYVLSLSPELFFKRSARQITALPMKGTAPRGRWPEEDEEHGRRLRASVKDRAENVMIADLLRNDIGRVAVPGSVSANDLFRLEKYRTVWQMVSEVRAELPDAVSTPALFNALFPCGSVTGAPKIRTMEIIRELEAHPRGWYTGAIGWIAPDGDGMFNVPIRTVTIPADGPAVMGVGSGITYDSDPEEEYRECLDKAAFSRSAPRGFQLLESLLLEDGEYFLFERHRARMESSAHFFDYAFDGRDFENALESARRAHPAGRYKVRLLCDAGGGLHTEVQDINPSLSKTRYAVIDHEPVHTSDVFLYHKTTVRQHYDDALKRHPEADEVLLVNERGEITEFTSANVVVEMHGKKYTPPVESGLLRGTYRQELLARDEIEIKTLRPNDLNSATRIFLINSVRKWVPVYMP